MQFYSIELLEEVVSRMCKMGYDEFSENEIISILKHANSARGLTPDDTDGDIQAATHWKNGQYSESCQHAKACIFFIPPLS